MPKISAKLTARQVDTAKLVPGQKIKKISDASSGLVLVITPGRRSWWFDFMFEGKRQNLVLGAVDDLPLSAAREQAQEARELVAQGIHPGQRKKELQEAAKVATESTFGFLFEGWFSQWEHGKTARHINYVRRRAEADVLPELGKLPIGQINAPRILAVLKRIERRGALEQARKARTIINQVFDYAIVAAPELTPAGNPTTAIKPAKHLKSERVKHQARVDSRELPALLKAVWNYDQGAKNRSITGLALRLLFFTALRATELLGARWEEFDFEKNVWIVPADRMKMKIPHVVPLSRQALAVLSEIREISGDMPMLFPNENRQGKVMTSNTLLFAFYRMGYKSKQTSHGVRGLFSTICHEEDQSHDVIELCLAHAVGNAVSAAYNSATMMKQRKQVMQWWADHCDQVRVGGKVLEFRLA